MLLCMLFVHAGGSSEADLQIRFVPGYALDPDAIKSYIKIGQLQETKKKWPAGRLLRLKACGDCVHVMCCTRKLLCRSCASLY